MKKFLLSLLGCAVLLGGCSKGDAGDKGPQPLKPLEEVADVTTKMPDARFAKYCLDNFDVDMDGVLSMAEAAEVTMIRLPNGSGDSGESLNLISLSGIEYFTNLTMLVCSKNLLTELDLSYNQKLEFLDCADNQITELDLSRISTLENVYCERNNLNVLTIPSSAKYLETLWCANNQLPALDVRNLTNLEDLDCSANKLSSLDLTGCLRLVELHCTFNQLAALHIPDGHLLEIIDCYVNQLTSLDLSHCQKLKRIECQENKLTSLDLSACPEITLFSCSNNAITGTLNLLHNPLLNGVYCENNPDLTALWLIKDHSYETVEKDDHTKILWDGTISIDGDYSDWEVIHTTDAILPASRPSDAEYSKLKVMRIAADTKNLYFYFEYIPFSSHDRSMRLYLDTDLNASTGSKQVYWTDCGAEYQLEGTLYRANSNNQASFDADIYDYVQSKTIAQKGSGAIISSFPIVLENGNTAIEFSIKRDILTLLGNSFKVGSDYSAPSFGGILPQGESSSWSNYVKTEMLTVDLE